MVLLISIARSDGNLHIIANLVLVVLSVLQAPGVLFTVPRSQGLECYMPRPEIRGDYIDVLLSCNESHGKQTLT